MSPPTGHKLLNTAMRERSFAPVYVFHGDDDFLKDQAVHALVDAAVDLATRDFNVEIRRAADTDAETLGSLLGTPPMMSDRRAVVVRDVAALRKDARKALDDYLRRPAPDTVLILVAPAGSKLDKQLVDAGVGVAFEPLDARRVLKWITYHTEHELRATITDAAATLLQDAIGTDLAQLSTELEKLASYCAGRAIDDDAVAAVVGIHRGATLGSLLDALAQRDLRAALALLTTVLQQPKTNAVVIVMALTTQTLAIAWAKARRMKGMPPARQPSDLFALLKEAGSAYTGRSWGDAVSAWSAAVERWTPRQLDQALDALLVADRALKDTRTSSDEQLLTSLILELCAADSGRQRVA